MISHSFRAYSHSFFISQVNQPVIITLYKFNIPQYFCCTLLSCPNLARICYSLFIDFLTLCSSLFNYKMSEIQDLNNWFARHTFQYEIPFCLTAPYMENTVFLNRIENFGLISSRPLGQIFRKIEIFKSSGEPVLIDFELINRKIIIEPLKFEKLLRYNQILQSRWYHLQTKALEKHFLKPDQFRQGGQRNYLFVPICSQGINFSEIDSFLLSKLQEQSTKIYNPDNNIYVHRHSQELLCNYYWISDCHNWKVREFLQILTTLSQFTIEGILQYFQLQEDILDKPLQYLLYDHEFNCKQGNLENLLKLRTIRQFDPDILQKPLGLFRLTANLLSIQYFTDDQLHNTRGKNTNSCAKQTSPLPKPLPLLYPRTQLDLYFYSLAQLESFYQLPTVMLEVEQQLVIAEFSTLIQLPCDNWLANALTKPSFHSGRNYELLETLGDTFLKFFATLHLTLSKQNTDENKLDFERQRMVSNNFLALHLHRNSALGLNFFVRNLAHQTKWYTPCLQNLYLNQIQPDAIRSCEAKLIASFLADIYEALLGAAFQQTHDLCSVLNLLIATRHPSADYPFEMRFLTNKLIQGRSPIEFSVDSTFLELVPNHYLSLPRSYDTNYLQKSILRYRFQNPFILQEAFNAFQAKPMKLDLPLELYFRYLQATQTPSPRGHQILEFLGDATLDCYILSNAFNTLVNFTPTHLYKVKMLLVSNSFLAKLAVVLRLHTFLSGNQLAEFEEQIDLKQPFRCYNGNFVRVPKVLSDLFEALVGALLMDGGWNAVLGFLNPLYERFLPFVCQHIDSIDDHVIDRVHQYSASVQGHLDIKVTKMGTAVTCAILVNGQTVGRATDEFERVAKEKAAEQACKRLGI